jgi:hypothetical protein
MIFAALLGPGEAIVCAATLGDEYKEWSDHPSYLGTSTGAALIDYLNTHDVVSFGGTECFVRLAKRMTAANERARAAAIIRTAKRGRDIKIARLVLGGDGGLLLDLCPGAPGPMRLPPPSLADWLETPISASADLANQIACVAFLLDSTTSKGGAALAAVGGGRLIHMGWLLRGLIPRYSEISHLLT